jgi:uncharacterized membrane protein YfcA
MSILALTIVVGAGSFIAGLVGALTGLDGGVVIVPLLVMTCGVDIHYAIGASLVSVIATSSSAAAAYVSEGYSNIKVAMLLEIATTLGALSGATLATNVPTRGLAIAFAAVLMYSAYLSGRPAWETSANREPDPLATWLRLDSSYPSAEGLIPYRVRRVPTGLGLMYGAGLLSGLLGIGSGAVKVLAMDRAMRLPFKVATTTSNFMIGVTAAASAGVYLHRGYVDPGLAMPVVLGVLLGSLAGAKLLNTARTTLLRALFRWVIVMLALEMLYNGLMGSL